MNKEDAFYQKLKRQLEETKSVPGTYTYKFIFLNDSTIEKDLKEAFSTCDPFYSERTSKNKKYLSLSVEIYVQTADQIITYYKIAAKIDGVIML